MIILIKEIIERNLSDLSLSKANLKLNMISFLLLCLVINAHAKENEHTSVFKVTIQNHKIKGTITDSVGEVLPGATVIEKGTNNGTQTDFDGKFTLKLSNAETTIVVSYLGFITKNLKVSSQTDIIIVLEEEAFSLNEIVMVGYSKVKKSDLTGSVSTIKPKDLNIGNITNVGQMLQGRVAGLYVSSANQDPGASPQFLLRGISSLQGAAAGQPLIVIDGFPMEDTSILNTINPNDIAQVDVLKDASASAIFGSRGANGVIIVTTKSGNTSGIQVDYGVRLSTQIVARTVNLMNSNEYARFYLDLANDPNLNGGFGPSDAPHSLSEIGNLLNTNWQKELINENNLVQDHNIAVSGTAPGIKYRFSSSYYSGDAVVAPSGYDRFNVLGKLSFERKKFSLNANIGYTSENNNNVKNSYENALSFSPSSPVYDEFGELSMHISPRLDWVLNPLFNETALENFVETNTTKIKVGMSYELLDGLRLELNGGVTQRNLETFTQRTKAFFGGQEPTSASIRHEGQRTLYADYFLKYNKKFSEKHNLSLIAGGTYYSYRSRSLFASSEGFPYVDIAYYNINAGLIERLMGSNWAEKKTLSGLFRLNYDYDKKYFITSSYRLDGASQFGKNQKWGFFPSVSIAYRIDKEDFFKDNVTFLTNLKLRTGYGTAGNDNIPSFRTQGLIDFTPVHVGGGVQPGIATVGTYKPNPDLHWEESKTFNVALEFGNKYFYAEIDVYNKKTEELLLNRNLPTETGFQSTTVNKGVMENKGIEGKVNFYFRSSDNKLRWTPGVWFSSNKNKILDFDNDILNYDGGNWIQNVNYGNTGIRQEGYSANAQWGHDFIGIWQSNEAAEATVYDAVPGDPKFADINGDKIIDNNDLKYLGDTNPTYTGGFSSKLNYKNFEFSFFVEGVFDKLVVNNNRVLLMYPNLMFGRNLSKDALDRWTASNPSNTIPSLTSLPTEQIVRSDWAMEDASFVRLREVAFSYTFDVEKSSTFKNLKVFCSATNIFTITNYSGLNPDVIGKDTSWNLQPYSRTFTLGFNASF